MLACRSGRTSANRGRQRCPVTAEISIARNRHTAGTGHWALYWWHKRPVGGASSYAPTGMQARMGGWSGKRGLRGDRLKGTLPNVR